MMPGFWTPADPSVFFSRKDPQDIRLGECSVSYDGPLAPSQADLLLWGYPDHEGIQLNGGRIGSAEAPKSIRTVFYKMTPHVQIRKRPRLLDLGDLQSSSLSLKDRHDRGATRAQLATDSFIPWASLGGGHDYGYADGAGFLRSCLARNLRPVLINFDAHLDVRPTDKGYNSGTPFFRLLNEFSGEFDFWEIGLQPHCNSAAHWDWALSQKAHLIPLSEISENGLLSTLQKELSPFLGRPLWLSLDIDAITSSEAPGCSQSWTTGLKTEDLMESFSWLMDSFEWRAFSIYEVSPPLDSDNRTVKLAAQFLHRYLSLHLQRGQA